MTVAELEARMGPGEFYSWMIYDKVKDEPAGLTSGQQMDLFRSAFGNRIKRAG